MDVPAKIELLRQTPYLRSVPAGVLQALARGLRERRYQAGDVIFRNTSTGQNIGWLMNGLIVSVSAFLPTNADTNWNVVAVGDMNGDGRVDSAGIVNGELWVGLSSGYNFGTETSWGPNFALSPPGNVVKTYMADLDGNSGTPPPIRAGRSSRSGSSPA